jgi:hypothetical protein
MSSIGSILHSVTEPPSGSSKELHEAEHDCQPDHHGAEYQPEGLVAHSERVC